MREEENKAGFTIVDKRGQNNPVKEREKTVEQVEADLPVQKREWKSVGYRILLRQGDQGEPIIVGLCAGIDKDNNVFTAEWMFTESWEKGFDWTIDATRRLDTFLQCPCSPKTGACPWHKRMAPKGWVREDMERIREEGSRPVPEAVEVLFKAEQARQQAHRILQAKNVLAPRR